MKRFVMIAALLCSPLAMAVNTGPTYPDDPHSTGAKPGAESTLNPIETPVPRDTDPRVQNSQPESPSSTEDTDRDLPGMSETGSEGAGGAGGGGANR